MAAAELEHRLRLDHEQVLVVVRREAEADVLLDLHLLLLHVEQRPALLGRAGSGDADPVLVRDRLEDLLDEKPIRRPRARSGRSGSRLPRTPRRDGRRHCARVAPWRRRRRRCTGSRPTSRGGSGTSRSTIRASCRTSRRTTSSGCRGSTSGTTPRCRGSRCPASSRRRRRRRSRCSPAPRTSRRRSSTWHSSHASLHLAAGVVRTVERPYATWLFRAAGSAGGALPARAVRRGAGGRCAARGRALVPPAGPRAGAGRPAAARGWAGDRGHRHPVANGLALPRARLPPHLLGRGHDALPAARRGRLRGTDGVAVQPLPRSRGDGAGRRRRR